MIKSILSLSNALILKTTIKMLSIPIKHNILKY